MRNSLFIIFISLITLILNSCSKNNSVPTKSLSGDVYISGGNSTGLVYWKNGNMVTLGQGVAAVGKPAVQGNDVYIASTLYITNNINHAVYLKNSVMTDLGVGDPTDIAVVGNDVYVSGVILKNGLYDAVYWKNGVLTDYGQGGINQITVSGNDVYMAGYIYNAADGSYYASYWKNGAIVKLGLGDLYAITISGSDVYAAGQKVVYPDNINGYWKNGNFVKVGELGDTITGIAVSGNDVYCSGFDNTTPTQIGAYWKNSSEVTVPGTTELNGVAALNNEVYFSGNNSPVIPTGQYSKESALFVQNNVVTTLDTSSSVTRNMAATTGITVVSK
jgi:hypothetical protein